MDMRLRLLWLLAVVLVTVLRPSPPPILAPTAPRATPPAPVPALWGITQVPYTPDPMHWVKDKQLLKYIKLYGIAESAINIVDSQYTLAGEAWWKRFQPDYRGLIAKLGYQYKEEIEDCDDFARLYATISQHTFRLQFQQHTYPILVGEFHYVPMKEHPGDPEQPHAICMVGLWYNNMACFQFVEPQSGTPIRLTKKEIESCYYVRF